MKRLCLLLMMCLPLLTQAQTYDTISGPNGRYHKYYYSSWFDSCGVWNDTQSRWAWGHPEVPGSLMINYFSSFVTDWSVGMNPYPHQVPAKTEYVPQPSALKGIAVVTSDSTGHPYYWSSNSHVSDVTSDTLVPDSCVVFTVEYSEMVILASGRWDTATPKIYKVPWHEDSLHSGFAHLEVFEVYFKTPIEVNDTFYISGTLCNMECDLVGNYLHPPHFYAQFYGEFLPDDPCLPTLEEIEYRRTHPNGYLVTWDREKKLQRCLSGFMQWGGFFPILAYDSVTLDVQTADSTMGLVSPQPGPVLQWVTHTITAYPNTGYKFTHWNDGDTNNPRRVRMIQDSTFTAYFAPKAQYQVAVSTESPEVGYATGGGTYYELDTATLEAFPASDQYRFSFWGDGNTSNPRSIVVTKDTSFIAFYREVTAIEEADGTQGLFTLTPNPTKGKVTVTVAQPAPKCELTLRDAAGHEVLRKELSTFNSQLSTTLDLSSFPAGAYFITLTTPTASSTQRLVVK